jgi:hypothetical protein
MSLARLPIGSKTLRRFFAAMSFTLCGLAQAQAQVLIIAAYPAVDSIAKSAAAEWKKKTP